MGIQVKCPHGHVFKVKDKYAGKKGLCPHCNGQVEVRVPDLFTATQAAEKVVERTPPASYNDESIFDDEHEATSNTSGSLLGSSVIQHNVSCASCGQRVPMWYAKCPSCGHFMDQG